MTAIAYLDICCFKRPFDDATAERVRREAEAVVAIFEPFSVAHWSLCDHRPMISRTSAIRVKIVASLRGFGSSPPRWFVTTDDRLLKLAARNRDQFRIAVVSPDQAANKTTGDRQ